MTGFAEKSQAAFKRIAIGGAGLFATGLAIRDALAPAIEMNDALLSASAQGVSDATLKQVAENGLKYSVQYGKSALEFVQSTEMIKSSVGGLSDGELPRMTTITNTVAAALKTTAAETTEFMGQMFANFRTEAQALGNVDFAERVAGKAAYMRQAFGTEMAAIKDLMEGSKGAGTNFGIGMDEQMAVLGELQRTLGSEASGSYESFLTGAAEGAKKLGLNFTDATGKMLSMPQMLEKLHGKYGASIEGNLKAQKELDEAFGGGAAVIKQLYGNVGVLQRHITELGSSDGMKRATEMAEKMANPWDRLVAVWYAIRAAMGATLLPVLYPLINKMADAGQTLLRWQTLFPNITRVIGYAVLAVLSFAAAGAVANIVMGIHGFVVLGLTRILSPLSRLFRLNALAMWVGNRAAAAFSGILKWLRSGFLAASIAARAGALSFGLVTWPIVLIGAAITGLIVLLVKLWQPIKAFVTGFISGFSAAAGSLSPFSGLFDMIGAALGVVWQGVKTLFDWFGNLLSPVQMTADQLVGATSAGETFGRIVASGIGLLLMPIEAAIRGLKFLWDIFGIIKQGWSDVIDNFSIQSPVESFITIAKTLGNVFSNLWEAIKKHFSETYSWIIEKLNYIPGINIDVPMNQVSSPVSGIQPIEQVVKSAPNTQTTLTSVIMPTPAVAASIPNVAVMPARLKEPAMPASIKPGNNELLTGGKLKGIERGGVNKEINNSSKSYTDNSKHFGSVVIHTDKGMTPEQLSEWEELR
ncbi:phage tail tape measure protein [Brenneria izadpanahii]|uniref:phage tail tape measure protein n=1 Tax=Brenneria izadpanahii TaxID=2722756 RepID=UPI001FE4668B|nr:phage tail tape measure protein [Brenneria izadpanahii]